MELNITILIRLIFAHFFADFILQTDRINKGKRGEDKQGRVIPGYKAILYQILHSLLHAVFAYVLVGEWSNWLIPAVIFASHFAIDFIKSKWMKENTTSFLIDQILHLTVIVVLWLYLIGSDILVCQTFFESWGTSYRLWAILAAYLIVLKPTSVFLCLFIGNWTPAENKLGLPNAGKWIGYLERVLILTFILTGNMQGVGFLLAAKSVFRFGELREAKQIKTTEYVLIGTLASFAIAGLVGLLLVQVL